ncbi:MAG TPA: ABC transporter permease subunit [Thermoplasmataceae archaeon]|nr:ABC transporter permease subunit [Thermoplasmatales archaeon AK]HLH86180.1 ABC transporter permease subunit [Thermoplasmataceae archaeon]
MNLRRLSLQLGVLALVLILWQIIPSFDHSFFLVSLTKVLSSYGALLNPSNPYVPGGLLPALKLTLYEVVISYLIAVAIGLPVGLAIGYFRLITRSFEPMVYLLFAIPGAALYPVFFLVFGLGDLSKIVNGAFLGVFPMIINVTAGVRQSKGQFIRLARSLGANTSQLLFKIIIPGATGLIMSGLRLTLSFVFIGVIFGEIIASYGGLGRLVNILNFNFAISEMYAVIILIVVLVFALLELIELAERRLLSYEKRTI